MTKNNDKTIDMGSVPSVNVAAVLDKLRTNMEIDQNKTTRAYKRRLGEIDFGDFQLVEIDYVCQCFNISRQQAVCLLQSLDVPLFHIGKSAMLNKAIFKTVIYCLTRAGAPGFAAPGSQYKRKKINVSAAARIKHEQDNLSPVTRITDGLLKTITDPSTLVEMAFHNPKNDKATMKRLKELSLQLRKKRYPALKVIDTGEKS